jgi:GDP/UDP-N,N'-diacetylbacillosamine 2-epimerase (hydrolysing)
MAPHDTNCAHAGSLGGFLEDFALTLNHAKPDWLVLAGDRGEQLMGAIAGAYSYIPTAHIQAGERSGNIDGTARMAIAKLAHLHFAANDDARFRLMELGEDLWRIHKTGAPQLDDLPHGSDRPIVEPYLLCVMHPTTNRPGETRAQVEAVKEAVQKIGMKSVWILPNNDPGWRGVLDGLQGVPLAYQNMPRSQYLQLLEHAVAIVGNSSSGLLEAPSYGTPAVNIGDRQQDRIRGKNVIDIALFQPDRIVVGIHQAQSMPRVKDNPYGDGMSAPRIVDALMNTEINESLLHKRMPY